MTAFSEIYATYFQQVYQYVLSLCMNATLAEEITQETFFKAMQKIDGFNGSCKVSVWLCQIAKNTYFTHCKKKQRITSGIDETIFDPMNLETEYLDQDTAKRLHILLHNLEQPYKEVFTLRVFGELPFAQIGELFGKTDSWARLIFYRAKKQLQEVL